MFRDDLMKPDRAWADPAVKIYLNKWNAFRSKRGLEEKSEKEVFGWNILGEATDKH